MDPRFTDKMLAEVRQLLADLEAGIEPKNPELARSVRMTVRVQNPYGADMNIETRSDITGAAPSDSLWTAIDADTYDGPESPIGHGSTQAEAIADLLEKLSR